MSTHSSGDVAKTAGDVRAEGWYCPIDQPPYRGHAMTFPSALYADIRNYFIELEREFFEDALRALEGASQSGKINKRLAAQLSDMIRSGREGYVPRSWRPDEEWYSPGVVSHLHIQREILAVAYYRAYRLHYINDLAALDKICKRCGIGEKTFYDDWHPLYRDKAEKLLEIILMEDPWLLDIDAQQILERRLLDALPKRSRKIGPNQPG